MREGSGFLWAERNKTWLPASGQNSWIRSCGLSSCDLKKGNENETLLSLVTFSRFGIYDRGALATRHIGCGSGHRHLGGRGSSAPARVSATRLPRPRLSLDPRLLGVE